MHYVYMCVMILVKNIHIFVCFRQSNNRQAHDRQQLSYTNLIIDCICIFSRKICKKKMNFFYSRSGQNVCFIYESIVETLKVCFYGMDFVCALCINDRKHSGKYSSKSLPKNLFNYTQLEYKIQTKKLKLFFVIFQRQKCLFGFYCDVMLQKKNNNIYIH